MRVMQCTLWCKDDPAVDRKMYPVTTRVLKRYALRSSIMACI